MERRVGAFVIVAAACSADVSEAPPDHPDFEVRYETEYVDVAPGFTAPVCRGSLLELDRHVEAVTQQLGMTPEQRLTLYWFSPNAEGAAPESVKEWCENDNFGGCYAGDRVLYSHGHGIYHELVHGLVIPTWGSSKKLFNEGVAEGLARQTDATVFSNTSHNFKRDNWLPSEHTSDYGNGHFSRWLVDEFGVESYRQLFGDAKPTDGDVFELVESVYGTPLTELEQDYLAVSPDIYPSMGLCDGLTHVPWQSSSWVYQADMDCDAPEVFGPTDKDGAVDLSVTLDFPDEPETLWTVWSGDSTSVDLIRCLDEPVQERGTAMYVQGIYTNHAQSVAAGRYRLTFSGEIGDAVDLTICRWNGKQPSNKPNSDDPGICAKP